MPRIDSDSFPRSRSRLFGSNADLASIPSRTSSLLYKKFLLGSVHYCDRFLDCFEDVEIFIHVVVVRDDHCDSWILRGNLLRVKIFDVLSRGWKEG